MHRWKFSVLAAAAVACAGFYTSDASALALGRITVQSALGEPLRAEIDLPQITPAEADTLRATTATPEVFRAQGMEYTPAIGLTSNMNRVYARFDKVIVNSPGSMNIPCFIQQIRPLDVKAVRASEQELREAKLQEREATATP